ncbi:MAG TPA: helix-turn-helix transcriptional regulator [Verrucomicrobiae bacterium]|nr:helix-turn-helix transcriptional regulator [Verrucomicrobiae bacterium]
MKTPADPAFDRFVSELYRSGLSVPPEGFRSWALHCLKALIPFDGALWGSGSIRAWRFHTVTLVGVPEEFPRALEETRPINPMIAKMYASLDTPLDMESVLPDRKFYASEFYQRAFKPFNIERILSTAHVEPRSGLVSLLSLYRRDRKQRFTPAEKALHKRATFHLFQAASHAYFLHLLRTFIEEREAGGSAAVVDKHGSFHEVQPRFLDLLEQHFPNQRLHALPFVAPAPGEQLTVNGLCVKVVPVGDLLCVLIWEAGPLDRLTVRERETVFAVTQGLSFKQAARKIGVAPSTVANHLYRIYRKLGVNSRSELAGLVYPHP